MKKGKKRVKKYTSYLEPRNKQSKVKLVYLLGYALIVIVVFLVFYSLSTIYLFFEKNILL